MKMWMQFNVMPWTSLGVEAVNDVQGMTLNCIHIFIVTGSLKIHQLEMMSDEFSVGWKQEMFHLAVYDVM